MNISTYHSQEMENIQEQVQTTSVPTPVVYLDLVKKLRQLKEQTEPVQEEIKELTNEEIKPRMKKVINKFKIQKQTNSEVQNQTNYKPRLPKLPFEEYQKKLMSCQELFMNELKTYLKEEIKTKETNEDAKTNETKTHNKSKFKKRQMTNLEKIQSGATNVNIIRVITTRVEPSKMEYLDNLLKNRQMNFIGYLSEFMCGYNIKTTCKSFNTILLHSPYIMV